MDGTLVPEVAHCRFFLAVFAIAVALFAPFFVAKADTFCLGGNVTSAQGWNSCAYLYTVNLNKSTYNAGETINASGAVQSNVCANYAGGEGFSATITANTSAAPSVLKTLVNALPQIVETNGVFTNYGTPSSGSASFVAPPTAGSYAMHFVGTGQSFTVADPFSACFAAGGSLITCLANPSISTATTTYDFPFSVVSSLPTVTLTATPGTITTQGGTTALTWASTNTTSCVGSGFSTGGATANGSGVSVSPTQVTQYGITCTGPGGTATSSATVSVSISGQPTATISGTGCTLTAGTGGTCNALLTWTSAHTANTLVDIYVAPASSPTSLTEVSPAAGSVANATNSPVAATTPGSFVYYVYNHGSTTNLLALSNTVTIAAPTPTVSCVASPSAVTVGGSVTWTAIPSGGNGAYAYAWSGSQGVAGATQSISATYNTTGTATAQVTVTSNGVSSTATCTNSVTVSPPASLTPPTNLLGVCAANGSSAVLSWNPELGATNYAVVITLPITSCPVGWVSASGWCTKVVAGATTISGIPTTPGGTYGWEVAAGDSTTWSAWTSLSQFICPAPTPDLTASVVTPTVAGANESTTFSAAVSNTGLAATSATGFANLFQTAVSLDGNGNGVSVSDVGVSTTTGSLSANGGSSTASLVYAFPAAGTYYLRVCANKNSASSFSTITETNSSNNCGPWTAITVSPSLSTVTATPCTLPIGGGSCNASLYWKITNADGSAYAKTVDVFETNPSSTTAAIATSAPADPTQSVPISVEGNYSFSVYQTGNDTISGLLGTGLMVIAPAAAACSGQCIAVNTCGMYTTGQYCSGVCSAVAPSNSVCAAPSIATFGASPARVSPGKSSTITWSATYVASCTLAGYGLSSSQIVPGAGTTGTITPQSVTTAALYGQAVYTLSCLGLNGQVISASTNVGLIPTYQER